MPAWPSGVNDRPPGFGTCERRGNRVFASGRRATSRSPTRAPAPPAPAAAGAGAASAAAGGGGRRGRARPGHPRRPQQLGDVAHRVHRRPPVAGGARAPPSARASGAPPSRPRPGTRPPTSRPGGPPSSGPDHAPDLARHLDQQHPDHQQQHRRHHHHRHDQLDLRRRPRRALAGRLAARGPQRLGLARAAPATAARPAPRPAAARRRSWASSGAPVRATSAR